MRGLGPAGSAGSRAPRPTAPREILSVPPRCWDLPPVEGKAPQGHRTLTALPPNSQATFKYDSTQTASPPCGSAQARVHTDKFTFGQGPILGAGPSMAAPEQPGPPTHWTRPARRAPPRVIPR